MSIITRNTTELERDEIGPGETIRVNHVDCPAGEDTRRRLYVTRVQADPTLLVGYCHNCGTGDRNKTNEYSKYRNHEVYSSAKELIQQDIKVPKSIVPMSDAPAMAQKFLFERNLTLDKAAEWGIYYDPNSDRVYLPMYAEADTRGRWGAFDGYQLRAIASHQNPKYLTARRPESKGYTLLHNAPETYEVKDLNAYVAIVEDYISGIHILEAMNKDFHCLVAVNYGTQINTEMLYDLAQLHKDNNLVVWLDNDSPHVIKRAQDISRTAALYGIKSAVVTVKSDPKHVNHVDIKKAMRGR